MFLGTLVHLFEEELICAGKVALERIAGRERIARVKVELGGVEVCGSRKSEFKALDLSLDVLHDDRCKLLVADVLVRVPFEQHSLDDLFTLTFRQPPSLLQRVTHVQHHLQTQAQILPPVL